jgi:transcription antitermination factor NusG
MSALVVNRGTGTNGKGFTRSFDGEAVRKEIAQFDWGSVNVEFKTFIDLEVLAYEQRQVAKRKSKKIKESEALTIWWDYFKDRKAEIGQISPDEKEKIIQAIMSGKEPPDALAGIKG